MRMVINNQATTLAPTSFRKPAETQTPRRLAAGWGLSGVDHQPPWLPGSIGLPLENVQMLVFHVLNHLAGEFNGQLGRVRSTFIGQVSRDHSFIGGKMHLN